MAGSRAPSEIFRERLREVRELRQLSQSELGERAGLQAAAISHFETGVRKPSFENLKRLADALEVSSDYLLGRVDELQSAAPAEVMYRDFQRLSNENRDFVRRMVADLAKKKR